MQQYRAKRCWLTPAGDPFHIWLTAHKRQGCGFDQAADFGYDAFKTTVDRSIAAFDGIAVNSKLNLEALADAASATAECAQTLSAQAAAYGKKAMEDHLSVAKKLATAKSVQEAFDIQTGYAKTALEAASWPS